MKTAPLFFTYHAGPDNSSKPMCLGCYRKVSGNYKCPGCKWPMCREACTRLPSHKPECTIFQLRKANVTVPWFDKPCSYYDAILPIRVLLLKMHNPKVYHLVTLLMDHGDSLDETSKKHRQRVTDFILKTCKMGSDFTSAEVHHVLGILSVNSFVVHDTDEGNLDLIGLYPWTSLMSHHCIANTKITTREDFSYVCEATVFIPKVGASAEKVPFSRLFKLVWPHSYCEWKGRTDVQQQTRLSSSIMPRDNQNI